MYFRFIDDVFSYVANQSRIVEFFERLNGLHEALRFTQEGERVCSLPFLDVKVSRTDDSIITSMYRKPPFTRRYTPWNLFGATSFDQPHAFTEEQGTSDLFTFCHRRGVEDPADHSVQRKGLPWLYLGQAGCKRSSWTFHLVYNLSSCSSSTMAGKENGRAGQKSE